MNVSPSPADEWRNFCVFVAAVSIITEATAMFFYSAHSFVVHAENVKYLMLPRNATTASTLALFARSNVDLDCPE
jgi:hypothetical protein